MNLKEPKGRLARWMVEVQNYDFTVDYAPGSTLVVADTLSRDAVGEAVFYKCQEEIRMVSEGRRVCLPSIEDIKREQTEEYGDISEMVEKHEELILDDDGVLCTLNGNSPRIVLPEALKEEVLRYYHGSKVCGHYGIARTAFRVKQWFWWKGWRQDLAEEVKLCVVWSVQNGPQGLGTGEDEELAPVAKVPSSSCGRLGSFTKSKAGLSQSCGYGRFLYEICVGSAGGQRKGQYSGKSDS